MNDLHYEQLELDELYKEYISDKTDDNKEKVILALLDISAKYVGSNNYDEANISLDKVLELSPKHPEAHYLIIKNKLLNSRARYSYSNDDIFELYDSIIPLIDEYDNNLEFIEHFCNSYLTNAINIERAISTLEIDDSDKRILDSYLKAYGMYIKYNIGTEIISGYLAPWYLKLNDMDNYEHHLKIFEDNLDKYSSGAKIASYSNIGSFWSRLYDDKDKGLIYMNKGIDARLNKI